MIAQRTAILLMLLWPLSPASGDDLIGQASVIDGDTIEIHATRIRLWGIDAPESTQFCRGDDSLQYRCGAKAANDLDAFIAGRPVDCIPMNLDQYGRTVATCSADGVDMANGSCIMALRWTGHDIRRGDTELLNAMPSTLAAGSGAAVTSSRGCIEPAFVRREDPPIVRMTQTRILKTDSAMCNLYSITTNQAAIIALFRVINHHVGNLPPMAGVFPDYPAPVVRNTDSGRELTMMRWGMPLLHVERTFLSQTSAILIRSTGAPGSGAKTVASCRPTALRNTHPNRIPRPRKKTPSGSR